MLDRESLDRTLFALADPTRRGVIDLLRKKPRKASDLADALAITRPAMSRHLRSSGSARRGRPRWWASRWRPRSGPGRRGRCPP
ncbi:MAG: hypothetical protein C4344_01355 [Acidimicrobiia bacterium]